MNIIGWIREGDQAACGGKVVEGDPRVISMGRAFSFEGARMACSKNCVIAEGFARSTLTNGRSKVIHGMKTSGGCPLQSTLNDIDGIANEEREAVPTVFFVNADCEWTAVKDDQTQEGRYDEQTKLNAPPIDGLPYYIETTDGRTFSGRTAADGLLPRIDTYGKDEYKVYWGDEALTKMDGAEA